MTCGRNITTSDICDPAGGGKGGGVLIVMHGRSRMIIGSCIPMCNADTLHVVRFSPTRQTLIACTKRKAKREVFGESHEG